MEQDPTRICEVVGWFRRCERCRRRRRSHRTAGGSYPDTDAVAAGVFGLRRAGALQRHQAGAAGGFAGVRAAGAPGVAQASLVLPGHRLCDRFIHRNQRRDRTDAFGVDDPCGALGNNSGGVATRVRCQMSLPSWVVTGTQSTKRCCAGGRRCWPPMSSGWVRCPRWGSMRPCSDVRAVGVPAGGAPRSWTCVAASCSTLWLVATRKRRSGGC